MSRRRAAVKRDVLPDSRYNDKVVTKTINALMVDGKKSLAESIFYSAMDLIKEKTGKEGYDVFKQAMENIKPQIEVRSRRIGGATYQVPTEVRLERQQTLALRWLKTYTRDRKEYGMIEKLAAELIAAANNEGATIKKKEDTYRMAEANRAFAHYKY
ncbi:MULTISPECIES: 30S ribosomal protein S7 [Fusobacterium]|uniref:30S ribosomal protein S7 n=1 Tax=Fusobacterium TaxID=848 RepID=UPI00048166C4|nr:MULTISPECIES: 30S ribosomal protein S7 [Fusobacterium]MCI6151532.1 30S ribosomal protein S7 [Fusobacterium perfoetens]MDY3236719.1 30S ribosomal protein S7 [Fusobacterium perfoetens]NME36843.1 30S ribosomal protein S7 [Fusobacterium sp. FSA-380-WT-3A]